jgi:hypothetical protein
MYNYLEDGTGRVEKIVTAYNSITYTKTIGYDATEIYRVNTLMVTNDTSADIFTKTFTYVLDIVQSETDWVKT